MNYLSMTKDELAREVTSLQAQYAAYRAAGLKLDISRGKPSPGQLALSDGMLECVTAADVTAEAPDCRNYGVLDGIPAMKELFSALTGIPAKKIIVGGNSSLNMMYDTVARAMLYGTCDSARPWCREEKIKFLCPVPGYDRHFRICESLGIEMINVPMTASGPDMEIVARLAGSDASVRGIWCVPKYSNPTGVTFSDECVRALVSMKTAAPDFRIFWDNAYALHDIYDEGDVLLDIFEAAAAAGNENRVYYFTSTSKITYSGGGVAMQAMSEENLRHTLPILGTQTIGPDKVNQLRHVRFLRDREGVIAHMKRHASFLRPRFECLEETMEKTLGGLGIAEWTSPRGGYFISLDVMPGCARRVYELARDAGVTLTDVGATFPYGIDPKDTNLRLAPSFTAMDEIQSASEILCCCVRLAAAEKLLEN